jgi:hypothetical protein
MADQYVSRAVSCAERETKMYILLFLIVVLMSALAVRWLLGWTLAEMPEDVGRFNEEVQNPSVFYDPRTWAIFQPIPLLSYRRDKRGRFRKMS